MAGEYLSFDAASSAIDGSSPGTALTVGPGTNYRLREFSAPAPSQSVQYAGSVDTEGGLPASRKHENRVINLKIMCDTAAALRSLQDKIGKVAREGGTLTWTLPNAETVIFDLLTADTFDPEFRLTFYRDLGRYCDVSIVLTAAPYGRGAAVTLSDHTETTLPVLIFTETGIKGDMPAAARLVVDNDAASTSMTGLIWGLQSRYYDSAATAGLFWQAESAGLVNAAAAVGPTGASGSGSNTAKHTDIGTSASQALTIDNGSAQGTHVGNFRVLARVRAPSTNTGIVSVQLQWAPMIVGATVSGEWVALVDTAGAAIEDQWCLLDLGVVSLPRAPLGTQGWLASVFTKATVATDDLFYDYFVFVPQELGGQSEAVQAVASGASFAVHSDTALSSSGSAWGRSNYEGDYIRIPVAGAEARTTRIIVMLLELFTAGGTGVYRTGAFDDLSARVTYIPRYLVVPSP